MSGRSQCERQWVANDEGSYLETETVTSVKECDYKIQVWDGTLHVWLDVPDQSERE